MKTGRQMKPNRIEKGMVEVAHELAAPRSLRSLPVVPVLIEGCFGLGRGYKGLAPPLRAV
jgi:hypothetical protein